MLRAVLFLALLAPSLALAQITVTETSDDLDDEIINIDECNGTVQSRFSFAWRITTTGLTSGDIRVSDVTNCPNRTADNLANTASIGTFSTVTGTLAGINATTIPTRVGAACNDGQQRTVFVCAVGTIGGVETAVTSNFRIDVATPPIPLITDVAPGDRALEVSWQAAANADRYTVIVTPTGTTTPVAVARDIVGLSRRVEGLTNNQTYDVTVQAISIAGNESAVQPTPAQGTPVEVDDFWRLYRDSGGREEGGCTTGAGAGALALLALVPLFLRRKRS